MKFGAWLSLTYCFIVFIFCKAMYYVRSADLYDYVLFLGLNLIPTFAYGQCTTSSGVVTVT